MLMSQRILLGALGVVFASCGDGSETVQDIGVADTGLIDSGLVDAGAVDLGAADAGGPDVGEADAGAVDLGPADTGVAPTISFLNDVQPIFTMYCTRCHAARRPSAQLNLTSRAGLHAHFVDQDLRAISCRNEMTNEPITKIVVPGEPMRSAMLRKTASLDSEAACEDEMPPRDGALIDIDPQAYETLRLWVEQGALDN